MSLQGFPKKFQFQSKFIGVNQNLHWAKVIPIKNSRAPFKSRDSLYFQAISIISGEVHCDSQISNRHSQASLKVKGLFYYFQAISIRLSQISI